MFKEFFTSLCREVFDTDHGLWLATKINELYPNPHAYATVRTFPRPMKFSYFYWDVTNVVMLLQLIV